MPVKAAKPRRQKLPEDVRRQAILEAAHHLFSIRGYERTRMDDVAARAGLTKGGLYFHFKDKRSLMKEVVRTQLRSLQQRLEEVEDLDLPAPEKYLAFCEAFDREMVPYFQEGEGEPGQGALELFLESHRLQVLQREIQATQRRGRAVAEDIVAQGIAAGLFRPVDPAVAAVGLVSLLYGIFLNAALTPREVDVNQINRQTAEIYLAGLLVSEPRGA
ncbi:MAG: TetR/AcrR family transcriptional regulator [Deltaproteobacteria bacterium]|nr:TetR/AcrR family transcriptional regulator [Deltaproteobacteria bacterium]